VSGEQLVIALGVIFTIIGYFVLRRRSRFAHQGNFQPTDEVFKDPTTGKWTRVYEDPSTGKRQYREEL
jgi:hypothetical protein